MESPQFLFELRTAHEPFLALGRARLRPPVGRDSVEPWNHVRPGKSGLDGVSPYRESRPTGGGRFMGRGLSVPSSWHTSCRSIRFQCGTQNRKTIPDYDVQNELNEIDNAPEMQE